jgi:hypothetical protein
VVDHPQTEPLHFGCLLLHFGCFVVDVVVVDVAVVLHFGCFVVDVAVVVVEGATGNDAGREYMGGWLVVA